MPAVATGSDAALAPLQAPPATGSEHLQANSNTNVQGAPPPLATAFDADGDANIARVMRGMQGAVNQQGGSLTLRLNPPELGVVRIQMEVTQSVVRAALSTDHDSVRVLLQHQIGQLRQALESQGLAIERLEVQTAPPPTPDARERQAADDGRSRGQNSQHRDEAQRRSDEHVMNRNETFEDELLDLMA